MDERNYYDKGTRCTVFVASSFGIVSLTRTQYSVENTIYVDMNNLSRCMYKCNKNLPVNSTTNVADPIHTSYIHIVPCNTASSIYP